MQLVISGNPDGSVSVSGPIDDKATCYALLELARDAIKDHCDKIAKSPIVPAQTMPGAPRLHT